MQICVLLMTIFAMIELIIAQNPSGAVIKEAEELIEYRSDAPSEYESVKLALKELEVDLMNLDKITALKNAIEAMRTSVKTKYLNQLMATNDINHANQIVTAINESNFKRSIELLKKAIAHQTMVISQEITTKAILDVQIQDAIEMANNALRMYSFNSNLYTALTTGKGNLQRALSPEASVEQKRIALNEFQNLSKSLQNGRPGDKPGDKPGGEPGDSPGGSPGDKPGGTPGGTPGGKPDDNDKMMKDNENKTTTAVTPTMTTPADDNFLEWLFNTFFNEW